MDRHLLVTVSEEKSHLFGLRFVSRFFTDKSRLRLTLFYTAPRPAAVWEEEQSFDTVDEYETRERSLRAKGEKALKKAKQLLVDNGHPEDKVGTKLVFRQYGKFEDVAQEQAENMYDGVVLGRRGLGWLERAFEQSMTEKSFEIGFGAPMWLCRRGDPDRKNVLLCLDGSEESYAMADHVGFMLGIEPTQRVTMFSVNGDGVFDPEIAQRALGLLCRDGFSEDRVDSVAVKGSDPARAILTMAETGQFASVAMGRTGRGAGMLNRLFLGSVSEAVFKKIEGASLWCCACKM